MQDGFILLTEALFTVAHEKHTRPLMQSLLDVVETAAAQVTIVVPFPILTVAFTHRVLATGRHCSKHFAGTAPPPTTL